MKLSFFIKSYQHDFDWLIYVRDSVRKFSGPIFSEIVLLLPEGETFDWPEAIIHNVEDLQPGYLGQQVWKCYADQFCTGDIIVFGDSDTVFTRPLAQEDFIRDGKPIWLYTPFGDARKDQLQWKKPMWEFTGSEPPNEFMRRHCFAWPREFFGRLRTFCQFKHRQELSDYIMSKGDVTRPLELVWSEFNCAGAFAWEHEKEMFSWVEDKDSSPAYVHQGHTHSGEARKQEDIAKFQEILSGSTPLVGMAMAEGGHLPPLTISSAIEFLASRATSNPIKGEIIRKLKKAWKGNNVAIPRKKPISKKDEWLLCIHSYPGANETVERHWNNFLLSGASSIVGIGTTDGGCVFSCPSVNIGENAYLSTREKDDHLCRRLLDTVKWCMEQPENKFVIAEYDVLFLRKFPKFHGICAFLTGGQINGSKTNQFFHGPWAWDRQSGPMLISALEAVLGESQEYPNNSPDLFFGLACQRFDIQVNCPWKMFTRNSLDRNGDLELAVQAAKDGVHVIHGCKQGFEFNSIMSGMNERELELSHAQ